MRPSEVSKSLVALLPANRPVYVWGPPGCGKSSVVKQAADALKLPLIDLRATLLDPVDLRGLPKLSGDTATWCSPLTATAAAPLVEGLLTHFFADTVESSPADLRLRLDLKAGKLQLLDAAPGGNGLSRAILVGDRAADALGRCEMQLSTFQGRGAGTRCKKYVLNLCQLEPGIDVREVRDVVSHLRERWTG